jgi:hypothetical protein
MKTEFLTQIDGIFILILGVSTTSTDRILMIGATNRPEGNSKNKIRVR